MTAAVHPPARAPRPPRPPEWRGLARDEVRLLAARAAASDHARFRDLPDLLAARRPCGRQHLRDAAGPARRAPARDGAPCRARVDQLDDGTWVVEVRRPDNDGPDLGLEPGAVLALPGGVRLTLLDGVPGRAGRPGSGARRTDAAGRRRPICARHGRPIRYGYVHGDLPAGRPTRTSTPTEPGQRRDGQRRPAVHRRAAGAADGPRDRRRPARAAHRRLQPGAARAAAAGAVRRPGGHRAAGRPAPGGRTSGRRRRHHRHPGAGVGHGRGRRHARRGGLDRPRARPRPAGPRRDRADHRPARARGQPPAAARGGRRRRTWSRRPTGGRSPSTTSGTSSATRCCSCPERGRTSGRRCSSCARRSSG